MEMLSKMTDRYRYFYELALEMPDHLDSHAKRVLSWCFHSISKRKPLIAFNRLQEYKSVSNNL